MPPKRTKVTKGKQAEGTTGTEATTGTAGTTRKKTEKKAPEKTASVKNQPAKRQTRNAGKNSVTNHETNDANEHPQQDDTPLEDQHSAVLFNGHPATIYLDPEMFELGHIGQLGGEWSLDCWHKNQNGLTICLSTSNARKRKAVHIDDGGEGMKPGSSMTVVNGALTKMCTSGHEPNSKRVKTGDSASTNRSTDDDALTEEFPRIEKINKTNQAIFDLTIQPNHEAPSVALLRRLHEALDRSWPRNEPRIIEPVVGPAFRGRRRWGFDRPYPRLQGQWQYATYDGETSSEFTAQMNLGRQQGFENVPLPSAQQVYELRQTLQRQGRGDGITEGIDLVWVPDGQDTEIEIDGARTGTATTEPSNPNPLTRPQPPEPPLVTETKNALQNVAWPQTSAIEEAAAENAISEQDPVDAETISAPAEAPMSALQGVKAGSRWTYDTNPTPKTLGADINPEENPAGLVLGSRTRGGSRQEQGAAHAEPRRKASAQESTRGRTTTVQNSRKARKPAPKHTQPHIPGLVNYEPPGDRSAPDKPTARQQSVASQEPQLPAIAEEKPALGKASDRSGKPLILKLAPNQQQFRNPATDQVPIDRVAGNKAASGSQRAQVQTREPQNGDSTQMPGAPRSGHRNQATGEDAASANADNPSGLSDEPSDSNEERLHDGEDADAQENADDQDDTITDRLLDSSVDVERQLQDVAEDDDCGGVFDPLAMQQSRSQHARRLASRRESEARRQRGEERSQWVETARKNTDVEHEEDELDESENSSDVSGKPLNEATDEDAGHDSGQPEAPRSSSGGSELESYESDSEGGSMFNFTEAENEIQEQQAIEGETEQQRRKDAMDRQGTSSS